MNKKPLFSIIIPTYNNAEKVKYALESISRQSLRDFEVIVCDDGSTDHTKEVIDSFRNKININYLCQEHWGGPALPRNGGLEIAKGDFVAFLDSDDLWYPNKLEVVSKYLNGADVLYHDLNIFTEKGKKIFKKIKGRYFKKPIFVDLMLNENCLFTSSVVVRKNIFKQIKGFNEEKKFISVEDFDAWLKISRISDRFIYIPQFLGAYFMSQENISKASIIQLDRIKAVYESHLPFLNHSDKLQANYVFNYTLGRINYKIANINSAVGHFKISIKSKKIKFKIRSFIWILIIYLKQLCSKK